MTPLRKLILALAMGCMPFAGAYAKKAPAKTAEPDSLTNMVALFVAENTRRGLENVLASIEACGGNIDRAQLYRLVGEKLQQPANALGYADASNWIGAYLDNGAKVLSQRMISEAANEPGAQVLPSGVVIRTIEEGTGANPTSYGSISMRYTGSLPDGTVFDSIGPADEPMNARVADLTPGLTQAMPYMKAGGTYVVSLPGDQAYGPEGVPGVIPPDCALRFEIELIETF